MPTLPNTNRVQNTGKCKTDAPKLYLEAVKIVSETNTPLAPTNANLLMQKSLIFKVCTETKRADT